MSISFTTDPRTGEVITQLEVRGDRPLFEIANPDRSDYVFKGLAPYVDAAAKDAGYEDWGLISRAKSLWPASQVQNSLGVMPSLRIADRAAVLERAMQIRQQVAVLLDGIDAAIKDVTTHLSMAIPPEVPVKPKRAIKSDAK